MKQSEKESYTKNITENSLIETPIVVLNS